MALVDTKRTAMVVFRLTPEDRQKFRVYCLLQKPPTSMQEVLEEFVKSRIKKMDQ